MNKNNFKLFIQASLDKAKSIANIKNDIKKIQTRIPTIKLFGTLDITKTKQKLNTTIKALNPSVKIDADTTTAESKVKKFKQQKNSLKIQPIIDTSQAKTELKVTQKETKSLFDRLASGAIGANLVRMSVQNVTHAIGKAISTIKELDAIKTDIQISTGLDDTDTNTIFKSFNDMAKTLNTSTKNVAEISNEFIRMGETVESANELVKSSQILSKVGMIDSSDAASYLISCMKGYNIAAQDSSKIVDKLTSVDLNAGVSAGGLAEALSKCSEAANNSGTSIDRLIGYTTTVGKVTQKSMSDIGNSFQSIYSRMDNIKIGAFTDDATGEALSDIEAVLDNFNIKLRDTESTYRDFDDVLDDIGESWNSFTQAEQNAVAAAIAGTGQSKNFSALMNNYNDALKYSETAANSAGAALESYGVYQDSIEAKTNLLAASLESLSTNTLSEDLFSDILEATAGIVQFLDKTNLLKNALAGLTAMGIHKIFASIGLSAISTARSTTQLTSAMVLLRGSRTEESLKKVGIACKGLTDKQLRLILSTKGLNDAERLLVLEGMGVEKSEQQQTLATLGFANAEKVATGAAFSFSGALDAMKTAFISNPIGSAIMAITTAVSLVTMGFELYNKSQQKSKEAMDAAKSSFDSTLTELNDINSKLATNKQRMDELNALPKLTFIEQSELDKLKETNSELERQQNAKKIELKHAAEELASANRKSFDKEYGDDNFSYKDVLSLEQDYSDLTYDPWADFELAQKGLEGIAAALLKVQKAKLDAQESGDTAWLDSLTDREKAYKTQLEDNIPALQAYRDNLTSLMDYRELTSDEQAFYDNLEQGLKLIYQFTDPNAWNSMEISNILNTKDIEITKNELIDMAKSCKLTPDTIRSFEHLYDAIKNSEFILEDGENLAEVFCNEIYAIAEAEKSVQDEAQNKNTLSFTDTLSQVQALSKGFDQLGKIYADIYDKNNFDWSLILNNDAFKDTFAGMGEAYHNFITTVTNTPTDIASCQSAFNNLAAAYIYNSDILANLTDKTKDITTALLEQMGIANANEIVEETLALKKQFLAVTSTDLANATYEEIEAFLNEQNVADETKLSLIQYQLQKELASGITLDTSGDVQNLLNLVTACGGAASALSALAKMKSGDTSQFMYGGKENYDAFIKLAEKEVQDALNKVQNTSPSAPNKVIYHGGNAAKNTIENADKAAGNNKHAVEKAAQDATETAEKAAQEIKALLDKYIVLNKAEYEAGITDFQTYLDKSKNLIEEYYRDGKISASDYWNELKALYENKLSIYKTVISTVTSLLDRESDKYQNLIDDVEKQNDALEAQLTDYEHILSAVDDVYQTEIDRLKEQQASIQDKIDALDEEADAYDFIKRREEALYALRRAEEQRTKKVFVEGRGFVYTQDQDAVREAQDSLRDIGREELIDKLEKEKDALNSSIELLEHYRGLWSEITDAKETETNRQLAAELFGQGYEQLILLNRTSDIEEFKENYLKLQAQIDDNTSLIESYQEKQEYYSQLKEQWQSVTDAYQASIDAQNAAQLLGADWESQVLSGRLDVINSFREQYVALQQAIADAAWASANEQIQAANAAKAAAQTAAQTSGGSSKNESRPANASSGKTTSIKNKNVSSTTTKSHINSGIGSGRQLLYKYGTGTKNAAPGYHMVAENGAEIIRDNRGNARIARGKQLYPFEGGEIVFQASETSELLSNMERLELLPIQPEIKSAVMKQDYTPLPMPGLYKPAYSQMGSLSNRNENVTIQQSISVSIPNITNESGFNSFKREMDNLKLEAYQYARRRRQ